MNSLKADQRRWLISGAEAARPAEQWPPGHEDSGHQASK